MKKHLPLREQYNPQRPYVKKAIGCDNDNNNNNNKQQAFPSKGGKRPSMILVSGKCASFVDCVEVAPKEACAASCNVSTGICDFAACNNNNSCCKYTSGNNGGGICANGCGDQNICIDANTAGGIDCPHENAQKIAICNTGSPFCFCLIENNCTKQNCVAGIANCCSLLITPGDFINLGFCARR
jgi:hypothetical protein